MIKVESELIEEAQSVMGEGAESEYTFLLVPKAAYEVVMTKAREEGCTAADIFQRAVLKYIEGSVGIADKQDQPSNPIPEPDIVIRRKRR